MRGASDAGSGARPGQDAGRLSSRCQPAGGDGLACSIRDVTSHSYLGGTFNRLLNPTTIGRMPNFYLPCKDGYVTVPAPMEVHWERLVEAMGNPAWALTPEFSTSPARTANWIELRMRLIEWTMTLSGATNSTASPTRPSFRSSSSIRSARWSNSDQVRARDSVVDVEIGNRRAKMPGAPFAMRATPLDAAAAGASSW